MSARIRVAVIGGGANPEHEVSLASAAAVCAHLPAASYEVVPLTIDHNDRSDRGGHGPMWRDREGRPLGLLGALSILRSCEVVFPALHGVGGEDGTIAALCQVAGLPCVGSPAGSSATAMDKYLTRLVAGAAGIEVAAGTLLTRDAPYAWQGPVVVKPTTAGSSRGVSLVREPDHLAPALKEAFSYDDRVLVEEIVEGREIDVAIFGRRDGEHLVAPALEIVGATSGGGFFDYDTKYGGHADLRVPAEVSREEGRRLHDAAIRMYDALGCRGLARIDFFLTAAGPVLLEVNTMPGLTEHSQAPRMFAAAGMPYADLLDLMVRDALG